MADTSGLPPAMTEEEARAEIILFTDANSAPVLASSEIDLLVSKARRQDYLKRFPSHDDWRPTWNLAYSIALGWQIKAGRLAGRTSFSVKGQTYNRDQFYKHCMEQVEAWKKRISETVIMEGSWRRKLIPGGSVFDGVQTNGYLEDDII